MQFNRGEWSELYALLELLDNQDLKIVNDDLEIIDDNTFKVNEISKDNIIVITQNANIKYIHIRKANQNFYYYQTDIEFIANNTYKLIFNLD